MNKLYAVTIFLGTFTLTLFGLILVLSASSTYSYFMFDSAFHLFNSHFFKVILGIIFLLLFAAVPYEIYKDYSKIMMIAITITLFATLIFASNIKGAGRWINLGFITFQPSDAAKLILIIHLAYLIESKGEIIKNFKFGFSYALSWIMIIFLLIFFQPNISNAILLMMISFSILYLGGAKFSHIFTSLFTFLMITIPFALIFPHSKSRLTSFVDGNNNLQVIQAKVGLGSGGLYGLGIGNSKQSNLFLPESYGDFIFAVLGEETGFIGSILVLIIYLIIFAAGIMVAQNAKDKFGQLLAFGISISFFISALINAGVATGSVPTTGLPLPFISYGGTSIIILSISIGILINIALSNNQQTPIKENANVYVK